MQWSEEAIVLSTRKFGESALLVEVFASTKGLYSGIVSGGQSKTKLGTWQAGNILHVTWRSRLEEQLGNFTGEVIDGISGKVICEPLKLQAVLSITSILRKTLIDRHPYENLYANLRFFLSDMVNAPKQIWLGNYIWVEVAILRYLGFALDLGSCAITGKLEGLEYISPKTGRAATKEAVVGYEEKLFKIPEIFKNEAGTDFVNALEITEFFLTKNLFFPNNRKIPEERGRFTGMVAKLEVLKVSEAAC